MRTILIGLTLATIIVLFVLVALLVIMRAGIHHQERAACLICHPRGLSTAIARRVVRMDFQAPDYTHERRHAYRRSIPNPRHQPCLSAKKGPSS
jgi:cytochrome c553